MRKTLFYLIIKIIIVLLIVIATFLIVYNDYDLYNKPIARVVSVENEPEQQKIELAIKKGDNIGAIIKTENSYDKSLVYDQKYHEGDIVFLDNTQKTITGVKRDHWVAVAIAILFGMLAILGGKQGLFTILCLIVNVAIFIAMTFLYIKGVDVLLMSVASCIFFAFILLTFVNNGVNDITVISFFVTIGTLATVGIICMILIWSTKNMGYEYLDFLPEPYTVREANHLFLSQIMIGCLGAVIDVSVTITACSAELIKKTPSISVKALVNSIREVADDITGTMINVIFFTNVAAVIPIFIVSMKNDIGFTTVIKYDAFFELARFFSGAISILIAIPFAVMASSLFMRNGEKRI